MGIAGSRSRHRKPVGSGLMGPQNYFVVIRPPQIFVRTDGDRRQFHFHHLDARGITPISVEQAVQKVHLRRQESEAQMYALFGSGMFATPEEAMDSARSFLQRTNPIGRIRTYKRGKN